MRTLLILLLFQLSGQAREHTPDLAEKTFLQVWTRVNTSFYEKTFNGIDWAEMKSKYQGQVAQSKSNKELRLILNKMLGELKLSHFGVSKGSDKVTAKTSTGTYLGLALRITQQKALIYEVEKNSPAIFPELHLLDTLICAKLLEDVKENDKTLTAIKVTSKNASDKTLYFDKETKLLAKMTSTFTTGPDGQMQITVSMSDYKEKDGIKYPSKMNTNVMGQVMQMNINDLKHNIKVADTTFAIPK